MAYSTQRDFINFPPCISENSDADGLLINPPTVFYSTFLQDLTNLWNRLSGGTARAHGGAEGPQDEMSASESGGFEDTSGEPIDDRSTRFVLRKNDESRHGRADVIFGDVEDMLLRLEAEGKLTIDTIMEMIRKYQDYIKQLLAASQVPEGGLKKLLEYIESVCTQVVENIGNLVLSEKKKNNLIEDVNCLRLALKTYICETQREADGMYQELQKANFDRQNLQMTLQKLTSVEGKIVNLKTQASKAYDLERTMEDLKEQLEKSQNSNQVLVQRLIMARQEQNVNEEKYKHDHKKLLCEMQQWKCKAELMHDINQHDCLELQKWKIHCSRLSLELDRATERILKGHEIKRKLYFAESMRTELEKQIDEMMAIINQLNEQPPTHVSSSRIPKDCEKALSNLLYQSKDTLRSILSTVQTDFRSQLHDENENMPSEIDHLEDEQSNGSLKVLEAQIRHLQHELDESRIKHSEELEKLRKQLEKCEEENLVLDRLSIAQLQEENRKLQDDLEKCQKENSNLKATESNIISQPSNEDVLKKSLSDASMKSVSSSSDHGDQGTIEIVVGSQLRRLGDSANDVEILSMKSCSSSSYVSEDLAYFEDEGTSVASYDSELESHSTAPEASIEMADFQKLLHKKNETINKLKKQRSSLQESMAKLNEEKEDQITRLAHLQKLEEDLVTLGEELADQGSLLQLAKDELKAQKTDIEESKELLQDLQTSNAVLLENNLHLHQEKLNRDTLQTEKEMPINGFEDDDKEYEILAEDLSVTESFRKKFNDKVRHLLQEKAKLESENNRLTKELEDLDVVVTEVNVERSKNRKMEELISDLEAKLQTFHQQDTPSSNLHKPTNYSAIIEQLKEQLEEEVNRNNILSDANDVIAKDIEDLKNLLNEKDEEILRLTRIVAIYDNDSSDISQNSDDAKYAELVNELRTQLDFEKHRYSRLRTKFNVYSLKIEDLEKRLSDKKAVIDREMQEYPDLMDASTSEPINITKGGIEFKKDENKRLRMKLILGFLKNEKLGCDCERAKNRIDELQSECHTKQDEINQLQRKLSEIPKEPIEQRLQSGVETVLYPSENEDDKDANVEMVSLLPIAHDFQETADQLKEQLSAEKINSRKQQVQIDEYKAKIEKLKRKLKKLEAHNTQLRNTVERRDKSIDELHRSIDELSSMTSFEDKGVQAMISNTAFNTSRQESNELRSELDSQVKKNFELIQDYSKEIENTQNLRNELKQTQREVRKLCKCVEGVEQEKKTLEKQNQELVEDLAIAKDHCTNRTCKNAIDYYERSQKSVSKALSLDRQRSLAKLSRKDGENEDLKMKFDKMFKGRDMRLEQICRKIQVVGIKSVSAKELAYLHRAVYKAGKNMRISGSESTQEKCREFVTSLPPVPANREEIIVARVKYLETELDNANQVLHHLKKEYEMESRNDERERHRGGENKNNPS